jgi:hypothetical protein
MAQVLKRKPFNKRAFISITMLLSGLGLPFSGFMTHKLQFEQLTMERHFWMSVHNSAAILFTIFVVMHISYNWRILLNNEKNIRETFISRESMTAIALVIIIVGLVVSHVFYVR